VFDFINKKLIHHIGVLFISVTTDKATTATTAAV